MRLGLTESLLILAIAAVVLGPTVAVWVDRWHRQAKKSSRAAAKRRAARQAAARAERDAILRRFQIASTGFLLAAALAVVYALVLRPIDLSPQKYTAPSVTALAAPAQSVLTPDSIEGLPLQTSAQISCIRMQEDWLYLALRGQSSSELVRLHEDGSGLVSVLQTEGELTGFDFDPAGSIWYTAVTNGRGRLVRVTYDGWGTAAETVVSQIDGSAPPCLSAVAAAPDGKIYFASAAALDAAHGMEAAARAELLAHTATGRVYVYDPADRTVQRVLSGLGWAGGLALSPEGDTLYISDFSARCVWQINAAARELACPVSTLAAGLPAMPGPLSCAPDGSVLVGCALPRSAWLEDNAQKTFLRGVALRLPLRTQARLFDFAADPALTALRYAPDGQLLQTLTAPGCGGALALCPAERRLYWGAAHAKEQLLYTLLF